MAAARAMFGTLFKTCSFCRNSCFRPTLNVILATRKSVKGFDGAFLCFYGTNNACKCKTTENHRHCWKCQQALLSKFDFFCKSCNVIQPPHSDASHFEIMNCTESFELDVSELTQSYRNLQRKLHPDGYGLGTKEEQEYSALQSSSVNKAYNTLQKPLTRGLYMLDLYNHSIEEANTAADTEFLMEIMEINEMVAEAATFQELKLIDEQNREKLEQCIKSAADAFSKGDYGAAKEAMIRMKYYTNIDETVKDKLD